jgi:hypothetical protein
MSAFPRQKHLAPRECEESVRLPHAAVPTGEARVPESRTGTMKLPSNGEFARHRAASDWRTGVCTRSTLHVKGACG